MKTCWLSVGVLTMAFAPALQGEIMLAPARETENDLLFIGGDFNNQPFSAYARAKAEAK
jgi:hypothetical protein